MASSKLDDQNDSTRKKSKNWLNLNEEDSKIIAKVWEKFEHRINGDVGIFRKKTRNFILGMSPGRYNQSDTYLDVRNSVNLAWEDLAMFFECLPLHMLDTQTQRTVTFGQIEKLLDSIITPMAKGQQPETEWRKDLGLELAIKTLSYVNSGNNIGLSKIESKQLEKTLDILRTRLGNRQIEWSQKIGQNEKKNQEQDLGNVNLEKISQFEDLSKLLDEKKSGTRD